MRDARPVALLFGGDFAPIGAYAEVIRASGGAVFGDAQEVIDSADFTLVNLESPVCDAGTPIKKSGPALRAEPETLLALTQGGVDAVCLANNHIFDFGPSGLAETVEALERHGIWHTGAGLDRSTAERPLRITIADRRISIFSFAEREFNLADDGQAGAALLDPLRIAPLMLAERSRADAMIVCIHGGNELFPWPRPGLRETAHFLIEMGADAVIGHHPHVAGAYEIHRGKPIFYSIGNLIFDRPGPLSEWHHGYFVRLNLTFSAEGLEGVGSEIIPYHQSASAGGLSLLQGDKRDSFLARIEAMRRRLEQEPHEWLAEWDRFVAARSPQVKIDIASPIRFRGLRRLLAFRPLANVISPPSRRLHRVNMMRCESHRELMISTFERH